MQWHFEFNQWEEAFKFFYRKRLGEKLYDDDGKYLGFREGDPTLAFIVSSDSYVSGYWIEPSSGAESDDTTQVYNLVADVRKLERRIRNKRARTKAVSLGGVMVY